MQNDPFVFNMGTSSIEARNIRLDNRITSMTEDTKVNRYDLWVLRHKIGGAKVFVKNVQWSDQMM
jgi:hypothetical protein